MIALLVVMMIAATIITLFGSLGIMLLVADDRIAIPGTDRARIHKARRDAEYSEIRREIQQKELQILALEDQRLSELRDKQLEERTGGSL